MRLERAPNDRNALERGDAACLVHESRLADTRAAPKNTGLGAALSNTGEQRAQGPDLLVAPDQGRFREQTGIDDVLRNPLAQQLRCNAQLPRPRSDFIHVAVED